ncbi:MAG TPA: hypothetical protein PLJ62_08310 [Thermoflexales bacterium]|nr:hypothetical protein [Thermoflexales bacterium]HQW35896.1 hypothetical protein [Thermoflexales bacterium]HQX75735.1 hypothetical protein [Thermoflexales bacterium]HQZ22914.1 hypothetical protein [Thermoflexales bacterium]HRA00188.1 hypothetical protein [Thermoflexales bacterium]
MNFSRFRERFAGRRGQGAQAQPASAPASAGAPNPHPPEQGSWQALAGLADGYLARMEPRAKQTPALAGQAQEYAKTLSELATSLDEAMDDKTALRFFETLGDLGVLCSRVMMQAE